jgi:hypothetical protein
MGRTACTEPQCLYSRAIPLLPLWAVRPVQSLSACTRGAVYLYLYLYLVTRHTTYIGTRFRAEKQKNTTPDSPAVHPIA